jgi:plasmid replication initiation protein
MLKEKTEIIKHSAAIQIENNVTLLQRKIWNVLFANAYHELPNQEEHAVNVQELMEVLGYESHNDSHLKEALKGLMSIIIEWNVLEKDKKIKWGATAMLASAEIEHGTCTYAYSPSLRKRLHNPTMYARISLELQNKFGSKHALALWELFQDYFDQSRQYGETPWIEIPRFRKLMAISNGTYPEFKNLNKWVIKAPIKEIQTITDYVIDTEYKRQGRKTAAVKFKIRYVSKIANDDVAQAELFVDTEGLPERVAEMVRAGVHRNKAMRIWSEGFKGVKNRPNGQEFDDYVREKLDLLQQESAKGNVDDKGAWLVSAIRDNLRKEGVPP